MVGTLYLVATPIGNLEDMTFRAVRILKEADLIAAEDTRNSIKLLNHFEIHTPMTSYHEHNKYEKADELIKKLEEGKNIAVITDAGTPGISDPGEVLVIKCHEKGISVTSVPGACAAVNALIISGQPAGRFAFEAFLPTDKKERRRVLDELKEESRTIVLYEAPHRLLKTITELCEELGNRDATVLRELTKKHETVFKSELFKLREYYAENEPKGECVIVIRGKSFEEKDAELRKNWENMSVKEHLEYYINQGMDKKEAAKKVASDRNVSKREIYKYTIDM